MFSIEEIYRMPSEVACDLIKTWIQPGQPALSGLGGWEQPAEDHYVMLLSATAKPIFDVGAVKNHLRSRVDPSLDTSDFDKITQEECDLLEKKITRLVDKKAEWRRWIPQTLLTCDQVSIPFRCMDKESQVLYRFAILFMNLQGEVGHGWAIKYLRYLASVWGDSPLAKAEWELAEEPRTVEDRLVQRLLELDTPKEVRTEEGEYPSAPDYRNDLLEWMDDPNAEYDPLLDLFPDFTHPWSDSRELLAYTIDRVQEWYENLDFEIRVTKATSQRVRDFVHQEKRRLFGGFDRNQLTLFDLRKIPRSAAYNEGRNRTLLVADPASEVYQENPDIVSICESWINKGLLKHPAEARAWLDGAQDGLRLARKRQKRVKTV